MALKDTLYGTTQPNHSQTKDTDIAGNIYRIITSQIGNLVAAFDLAGCLDVQLGDSHFGMLFTR
jgi:hypothetical protein